MATLRQEIQGDDYFIKLRTMFETGKSFQIDPKSLLSEMARLQSIRISSRIDYKGDFVRQLIETSSRDQSYRSRLAEIQFSAFRAKHVLSKSVARIRDYLLREYWTDIAKEYRTVKERSDFVDGVLVEFIEFCNDMDHLCSQADILIKDIDQSSWSLKLMRDAVEIHTKREHVL